MPGREATPGPLPAAADRWYPLLLPALLAATTFVFPRLLCSLYLARCDETPQNQARFARGARSTNGRVFTGRRRGQGSGRSEEHTSELQSRGHLVCRLLLEKKK